MTATRSVRGVAVTKEPLTSTTRSVRAVAITRDPAQLQLRNVRGFALTAAPQQLNLRNVRGFVLSAASKAPPAAGIQAMLWLINQNAKQVFTLSQISIGSPAASSDPRANSQVVVSALPGSGYGGSITLYYNRRTLASVFSNTAWLLPTISSDTTIKALIPQINSAYGVNLDPTDVVDAPVKAGATSLTLQAASTSYVFQPGDALKLPTVSLSSVVTITYLAGFDDVNGNGPTPAPVNTVALFHFNGNNGDRVTKEETGRVVSWSGTGNVLSNTQVKFGTTSLYCPGTAGSFLSIPDSPDLRFSGDMTIEWWQYTALNQRDVITMAKGGTSGYSSFMEIYQGKFSARGDSTINNIFSVAPGLVANKWQHIAVVRDSVNQVYRYYVDGVLQATANKTQTFGQNNSVFSIGAYRDGTLPLNGYLDEIRISKIQRYKGSTYTVPTAPFTMD